MIVLYKGRSALSRAIRWWTRSDYSHAAWERSNGNLMEAWTHGVRMVADFATDHARGTPVEWYRIEGATLEQRDAIECFLTSQLGKRYDYRGVFGFVSHKDLDNPDRWFCSELIFEACRMAGLPLLARVPAFKVSPGALWAAPRLVLVKTGVVP